MYIFVHSISTLLAANAIISFFIAFYWQAKVIFTIMDASDGNNANELWKAIGNQNSPQNAIARFFAGELFPELRRKWLRAIMYVVISFATLFTVAG